MSEWLRPILGAALLVAAAGGVAYKVISGYRHASPDAFFSVNDRRSAAASAIDHPTQAATTPVDVAAAPAQSAATAAAPAPITAAQSAPVTAAPSAASGNAVANGSRAASSVALPAEAQDDPACVSIKAEQGEIQGALKKQYSPEQGRFMQRRLRELAGQSVNLKCAE